MRGPDPMVDHNDALIIGTINGIIVASDRYCTEEVFGTAKCTNKSTLFEIPSLAYILSLEGCSSVIIVGLCKRHAKNHMVSLGEARRLLTIGEVMVQ
jgi:hypothetical protein